jgi:hypothetical protein
LKVVKVKNFSSSQMTKKVAMEEELKTLQKHFGGMVKTMLDMKSKIQDLEKKVEGGGGDPGGGDPKHSEEAE